MNNTDSTFSFDNSEHASTKIYANAEVLSSVIETILEIELGKVRTNKSDKEEQLNEITPLASLV